MTSDSSATGTPTPVLGVLNAPNGPWIENVATKARAHSVAADPSTGQVFVPLPNSGIAVFAGTRSAS